MGLELEPRKDLNVLAQRKAKVAVVGCGRIALRAHLPVIEALSRDTLELVAVCDAFEEKAQQAGEKCHVPYYTSIEQMLEEESDIDFVDVCTPDYTHHIVAGTVAAAGKHLLIEKPMAITLRAADQIVEACKTAGVHCEIAENLPRMPVDRVVAEIVKQGVIGEFVRMTILEPFHPYSRRYYPQGWNPAEMMRGVTSSGPVLRAFAGVGLDEGCHRVSQIRLTSGREVKKVVAATQTIYPEKVNPPQAQWWETWEHAILQLDGGGIGVVEVTFEGHGRRTGYRQVLGTQGCIEDDRLGKGLSLRLSDLENETDVPIEQRTRNTGGKDVLEQIVVHSKPQITWENPFKEYPLSAGQIGTAAALVSIAGAALYDKEPEYDAAQGRKDIEACLAAYESSFKGMVPVEIPLTAQTSYEQMLERTFEETFGRSLYG